MTTKLRLTALSFSLVPLFAWACGGADETLIAQPGVDSGATPDSSGPGADGGGNPDGGGVTDASVADSSISCTAPMANCSGKPSDGCNVNLLTDNANCGGCGVVCNTACTNGTCPLISADAGAPPKVGDFACLTVDAKNVYWATGLTANTGGSVYSVPINGGNPTLVVGNQDRPHGIATDGTSVFYGNFGTNANTGGIYKVPVGGGQVTTIATNQASPFDVVVDATTVYWTNSGDGTIWSSDKSGMKPQKIGGGGGNGHANRLVVDAQNVYWTDPIAGVVNRMPLAGGNTVTMTVANGAPGARGIAIDGTNAYVASNTGGSSALVDLPLGSQNAAVAQIVPNQFLMQGVAVNSTSVYWANAANTAMNVMPNTGTINRSSKTGQNVTALATGQNFPGCIALDSTSVYWINMGGGTIAKTAK